MLQHVTIEVARDQAEACADFYALLGFERVSPPASLEGRALWVEREGTQVHVMPVDDPVVPVEGHHALLVDDFAAAVDRLRSAGFSVEPRTEHWGEPRAFVRDPAGHRVELMAGTPARLGTR